MKTHVYCLALLTLLPLVVAGCSKTKEVEDVRPVRSVIVESKDHRAVEIITGQIAAHAYVNASFRLPGKVSERLVSAGSVVKTGQLLARLDDTVQKDALVAAGAEVSAAKASLEQVDSLEKRASVLIQDKAISQNDYDEIVKQLKSARAQVQGAEAKARIAKEQLDYTQIKAGKDGIVTDKLAEVGEVVAAGQPVLRIAEDETRDAIFDMPEEIIQNGLSKGQKIEVCLDKDRAVCAASSIYEIAPDADPMTRTYQTKTVLEGASPSMMLGSTVVGRLESKQEASIQIPASALTISDNKPAVWVVEPSTQVVAIKLVEISRYTEDQVIITKGLDPGEAIVTAGVQVLHQGQKVKLMEVAHEQR